MWVCAVLALSSVHWATSLRDVPKTRSDRRSLSNIELLIPLSLSDDSSKYNRAREPQHRRPSGPRVDHDETFSSIPAYAFSLDEGPSASNVHPRASSVSKPEVGESRSLYLAQVWPHAGGDGLSRESSDSRTDSKNEARRRACRSLAQQQSGSAREIMQYLCTELIDLLSTRCDCCAPERDLQTAPAFLRSFGGNVPFPPPPWFAPVDSRRGSLPFGGQAVLPRPRVFV